MKALLSVFKDHKDTWHMKSYLSNELVKKLLFVIIFGRGDTQAPVKNISLKLNHHSLKTKFMLNLYFLYTCRFYGTLPLLYILSRSFQFFSIKVLVRHYIINQSTKIKLKLWLPNDV